MKKTLSRIIAVLCGTAGFAILAYVFFPILAYEVNSPRYATYLSPVPDEQLPVASSGTDFTRLSNWFEKPPEFAESYQPTALYYTITIPKLRIKNAMVSIGGEDLTQNLIQYPGTAVPGKLGNAVIFGHSILPRFYNPKDYLSIFSTLDNLKKGDEIYIDYDGVHYTFIMEDKFEVSPSDIQILEQNPGDAFLTLVTCSPPGHPLKPRRLIIRARIVPLDRNI